MRDGGPKPNRTTLLARMKKLGINPKLFSLPAIRIAAIRLRGATRLRSHPFLLTQNTRASMLLTAKTDTDSFDTTITLFAALR